MDYLIYNLAAPHLQELADTALLSRDEQEVALRRGAHYLLSRCLLRRELARRLGSSPQDIRFRYGQQGKPECENGDLHFNISHSGNCLAMAFDDAPIGIDVEFCRPRGRMESLATRIMCPEQLAAFRERGCPVEEFYACWCAAEALAKQGGKSIWRAKETPFLFEHGRIRLPEEAHAGLRLQLFTPLPGYAGALVCAGSSFP